MSASVYESIQKANQSGLFVNLRFGQPDGFENPEFVELDLITKAEVGPETETKEIKARRMTRSGSIAETVKGSKWKAKADLIEYKLADTSPGARAFHQVKDATRQKPTPGMVDILHVEEMDASLSYATRAICIIKPSARNENEDDDVSSSYEFVPGVNAYLNSEYNGKVAIENGEVTGFIVDGASTGTWAL